MSFIGLAVTSPHQAASLLDPQHFQPVIYADTPRTQALYERFLRQQRTSTSRRAVLFLYGGLHLNKVMPDAERFTSIVVSDDLSNLRVMRDQLQLQIVDVEEKNGVFHPKPLKPMDFSAVVGTSGYPQDKLTAFVSTTLRRGVSVLETTSNLPKMKTPGAVSGVQKMLSEVTAQTTTLTQHEVLHAYARFIFRLMTRNELTQTVTKKLPSSVRTQWDDAIQFAKSPTGEKIADLFKELCTSVDPDVRVGNLCKKYQIQQYGGDVLFLTMVYPPSSAVVFPERDPDAQK